MIRDQYGVIPSAVGFGLASVMILMLLGGRNRKQAGECHHIRKLKGERQVNLQDMERSRRGGWVWVFHEER